jgi:cephalosporin hydroxylase
MVRGHTAYKGYTAQQVDDFYPTIKKFLEEVRPARILEIGTAGGGFILAVKDILNELGLSNVPVKTFDVIESPYYKGLRSHNVEVNIENIFDHAYLNLVKPEMIVPYIQEEGTTIVFCDGGHKVGEFNSIAPHIKTGDFILAHDYIDTWDNFQTNYRDKIWNWCEVEEKYIEKVSIEQGLEFYNKEEFDKIVWVCKKKVK